MSSGRVDSEYVTNLESKLSQARHEVKTLMEEKSKLQDQQVGNLWGNWAGNIWLQQTCLLLLCKKKSFNSIEIALIHPVSLKTVFENDISSLDK